MNSTTRESPLVSIVGRPNVGKSTLFNRLAGRRISITHERSGVTRDKIYAETEWRGHRLRLADTGGIGGGSEDPLHERVEEIARGVMEEESDLVLFMVDGRVPPTGDDTALAERLRRLDKPVVLAINKVDSRHQEPDASESFALGFEDAVMISALNGRNVGEMLDLICDRLDLQEREAEPAAARVDPAEEEADEEDSADHQVVIEDTDEWAREKWGKLPEEEAKKQIRASREKQRESDLPHGLRPSDLEWLEEDDAGAARDEADLLSEEAAYHEREAQQSEAEWRREAEELSEGPLNLVFVGRRNAGKSSLTNMLLGERRALVSEVPGTTRDSLTAELEFRGRTFELLDTAGMKKVPQMKDQLEYYAQLRADGSLRRGEVAVLVIDADLGVTRMDKYVAKRIAEEGKAVVVAVNKWDLVEGERDTIRAEWEEYLDRQLHELTWAPRVFTSATEGRGGEQILESAMEAWEAYHRTIPREGLELVLEEAVKLHPAPVIRNQPLEIYGIRQVGIRPPSFEIAVNDEELVHADYPSYLKNQFRDSFALEGTSVRLFFRTTERKGRA